MNDPNWWKTTVFYQIYPRSFADGNGDGIGDLPGIIAKLDYLKALGIGGLWLSPHFPSPNVDCGYDISDYTGVAPEYGTLDDFKRFLDGAHERGMRVVLDMVFNHTSDQHPWFLESRASRENPKRDWYVWRDPAPDGGPPNNWMSAFGGPAWEFDAATGQYYYHFFFKQQPDLNWRNPEVKQAMWDAVRFWYDLGVDGMRLDAIGTIYEDPAMPNHTATMSQVEMLSFWRENRDPEDLARIAKQFELLVQYQFNQPGVHELMKELRTLTDQYPGRVLIGEDDNIAYYGNGHDELHMIFNFPLMRTNRMTPAFVRDNQAARLSALPPGAWACNTLGNHDQGRMRTAFSEGSNDLALVKLNAALMLTLKGTPFLYNGEEIGMTDYLLTRLEDLRDNQGVNLYHAAVNEGGVPPDEAIKMAAAISRDRNRTPHQWANAPNAGFSPAGVATWLPVNPDYAQGINVADQEADPDSILHYYRKLIAVRQASPALMRGEYDDLHEYETGYFAFQRMAEEQTVLVILNYSDRQRVVGFDLPQKHARLLFSTHTRAEAEDLVGLALASFEVYIAELT